MLLLCVSDGEMAFRMLHDMLSHPLLRMYICVQYCEVLCALGYSNLPLSTTHITTSATIALLFIWRCCCYRRRDHHPCRHRHLQRPRCCWLLLSIAGKSCEKNLYVFSVSHPMHVRVYYAMLQNTFICRVGRFEM